MEGIVPPFADNNIRVPYRAVQLDTWSESTFYHPRYDEFPSVEYIDHLGYITRLFQFWLFFGLLSTFLESPVNRNDFIVDGTIELGSLAVHNGFRKWRKIVLRLSAKGQIQSKLRLDKLLDFALQKSEELEDAAV